MKLKKAMIVFGTVCILNTMFAGCGSGSESAAKTEETADTKATEAEANPVEPSKPEVAEEDGNASPQDGEITEGDPIAGIVEKYEGNKITIRTPEDDMLYYFSTENAQIMEGFSTQSAHAVEGDPSIAVGDKVEISYRGLIDFDEEHPDEAVKIVVITVE